MRTANRVLECRVDLVTVEPQQFGVQLVLDCSVSTEQTGGRVEPAAKAEECLDVRRRDFAGLRHVQYSEWNGER